MKIESSEKSAVLDEVFKCLDVARSSLDTRKITDAIGVLEDVGNLLFRLTENKYMDAQKWNGLAMSLAEPIQAAVQSARDEMEDLEKGVLHSYNAYELLVKMQPELPLTLLQKRNAVNQKVSAA